MVLKYVNFDWNFVDQTKNPGESLDSRIQNTSKEGGIERLKNNLQSHIFSRVMKKHNIVVKSNWGWKLDNTCWLISIYPFPVQHVRKIFISITPIFVFKVDEILEIARTNHGICILCDPHFDYVYNKSHSILFCSL